MNTIMVWFWFFVNSVLWGLPWIAISAACLWTLKEQRKSKALALQAFGAVAYLGLMVVTWVVLWILSRFSTPESVFTAVSNILAFLEFVALAAFAAGFCWEKWILHRAHKTALKAGAAAQAAGIVTVTAVPRE